ncbi:MAG: DUF5995 family protein [Janthinobacterium lividum]
MLPTTIDEVIAELEQILDTCARTNNRLGYFAALYYKVTCRVREGIKNQEFEDGPRMERLDVTFANRYLQAWRTWQAGQPPTASWQLAFQAGTSRQVLVLQHLLLGMNAHINLDLGIAAAEVAAASGLPATRKDFLAINGILALLTGDVMASLRRVSPLLSLLGLHATRYNSILIQFSLSNARDGAWCFAEELADQAAPTYTPVLQARDKSIAELATSLTRATGLMRLTLWAIHVVEWRSPARIMQVLRDEGPRAVKAASVQ